MNYTVISYNFLKSNAHLAKRL